MDQCSECGRKYNTMRAIGAYPRCKDQPGGTLRGYTRCVLIANHRGCHKQIHDGGTVVWHCVN